MHHQPKIAIIGAGNMGTALAKGLIASHYPKEKIWMTDPSPEKLNYVKENLGIQVTADNEAAVNAVEVVLLAVKPQIMATVAMNLLSLTQKNKPLIISIAAGIQEESLQKWLGGNLAIVRVMPNTPALIGCGASGLYANNLVNEEQKEVVESILRAVGVVVWVQEERWLDTVTALSGSGPAYFFLFIESLQKAAEELGLPSDVARLLTLQTAYGAARMALESEQNVKELRQQVTSPGGTTEKAIRVLEEGLLHELIKKALDAAKKRSEELAKQA